MFNVVTIFTIALCAGFVGSSNVETHSLRIPTDLQIFLIEML